MSTPEERLKERAEELTEQRRAQEAIVRDEETKRRQIEARVKHLAAACLGTARALADTTGAPIQVWLSGGLGPTEAGFRVRAGTSCTLVARLSEHGWDVVTHAPSGDQSSGYATDQDFEKAQESLLEPVIAGALETLLARRDSPLPGSASSRRRGKISLFSWLWRKLHRAKPRHVEHHVENPGPRPVPAPDEVDPVILARLQSMTEPSGRAEKPGPE